MAWQIEMPTILRYMINDVNDAAQVYSDERLQELLVVSAQLVGSEMDFSQLFITDVVALTITPDPTNRNDFPTRDDSFINLVCMKAACITEYGELKDASTSAVSVKEGAAAFDLKGPAQTKLALYSQGWCKSYADAKEQYLVNKSHIAGAAIMTPFRVWAAYGLSTSFPQGTPLDFRSF